MEDKKIPSQYPDDIRQAFNVLKFKGYEISLIGSASKKDVHYSGDYDFITLIPRKENDVNRSFFEFKKIFEKIDTKDNFYFIEFKLQTKNNQKIRWYPDDEFTIESFEKEFDNVDFCKIDLIVRENKIFREISCIYAYVDRIRKVSTRAIIKSLRDDIKELKKEQNYFKILKRQYSIADLQDKTERKNMLLKILNGELGEKYFIFSNLETAKKLLEFYDTPKIRKEINLELKELGVNTNIRKLQETIEKLFNFINENSKKYVK